MNNGNDIKDLYFQWLCSLVDNGPKPRRRNPSYSKLYRTLFSIQFDYILEMDGNRASDGEDLRYRFGQIFEFSDIMIAQYLDNRPCSVFEMMVALAIICEDTIMSDPDVGDRTGQWFWEMIESLGLDDMYDTNFNLTKVHTVINTFMNRKYERNGRGGLFTIGNKPTYDMRTHDIWYMAMWHFDEKLGLSKK